MRYIALDFQLQGRYALYCSRLSVTRPVCSILLYIFSYKAAMLYIALDFQLQGRYAVYCSRFSVTRPLCSILSRLSVTRPVCSILLYIFSYKAGMLYNALDFQLQGRYALYTHDPQFPVKSSKFNGIMRSVHPGRNCSIKLTGSVT